MLSLCKKKIYEQDALCICITSVGTFLIKICIASAIYAFPSERYADTAQMQTWAPTLYLMLVNNAPRPHPILNEYQEYIPSRLHLPWPDS